MDTEHLQAVFDFDDARLAPGGVIGVNVCGRPLYRRAFGFADLKQGRRNLLETPFPIGSVTKQFTAFAAALLAEDGVLDIDHSVRAYVPELPVLCGEATLRQLMTHSGGYRCYLDANFADGFALKPAGAALAFLTRQSECEFPPGSAQEYNNSGYFLLSVAIERVTGQSFEEVLQARIFDPLGLNGTRSVRSDASAPEDLARAYVRGRDGHYRLGVNVSEERLGDGAMVSSVEDMLAWLSCLREGHSLASKETWRQLTEPARLPDQTLSNYALGLQVRRFRGVATLGHGGNVMGASCHIVTAPDHGVDVVVLLNEAGNAEALAFAAIEAVLGKELAPPPRWASASPGLAGLYFNDAVNRTYRFVVDGDHLSVCALEGAAQPLSVDGAGLVLQGPLGETKFSLQGDGIVEVCEGGLARRYARVEPPDLEAEAVLGLAGAYWCADVAALAIVVAKDALFNMVLRGAYGDNELTLTLIARDLFVARHQLMPFTALVRVMRRGDLVEAFEVSTARTKRLRFERMDAAP